MTVTRTKFSCRSIRRAAVGAEGYEILFEPVYSGSEENRDFYTYTPAGQIRLCVVSPSTAEQFQVGRDYYVDFTPAPEPV